MVEPKKWNERSHATLTSFLNVHIRFPFLFLFFFLPRTFKLNLVSSRYFIYRGRKIVLFFSLSFISHQIWKAERIEVVARLNTRNVEEEVQGSSMQLKTTLLVFFVFSCQPLLSLSPSTLRSPAPAL